MGKTEEAQALFDTFTDAGLHPLGSFLIEMRNVLATDKTIESVDQSKESNFRVTPSHAIVDLWKTLGVIPTPVDILELYRQGLLIRSIQD
jgi:TRAP-type C4-dicarboxylate transport system substrate-binding protein